MITCYTVVLARCSHGSVSGTIPALRGCVALGTSRKAVLRRLHQLAMGRLLELYYKGRSLPRDPEEIFVPCGARTEGIVIPAPPFAALPRQEPPARSDGSGTGDQPGPRNPRRWN
jgi:predicted RNase H-like HicB family nuclease